MKGLSGKAVLVTGGGGAIGAAICRRFAAEGARLLVADRVREAAERVAAQCKGTALVFDIADYAAAKAALTERAVDVLVNNAGWDRFQNFIDTQPEDWEQLIAINLRGPLNMHHIVLPQMLKRGRGRIVNISSDAARVGSSGEAVYSACKGGIISFSKTLAREVARKGTTVNVVCPGPTDTPILRGFLGEGEAGQKVYDALVRAIPMKRVGQPDDIPGVVAFLASDEAAFITGQVLSVSGGLTMAG
ncbi:MAG: SDR family oxidoreductase [Betaproteobacteria bacterium]|nr:MAG: SDR family oxidoreductase [Betaproteobacteria bacterium]TMH43040.1 MAG: SDR family oxidoreductase [Betaproteobacteria bacterium]